MATNSQIYESNESLDELIASARLARTLKNSYLNKMFDELYEEIKHGDQEHQDWLKNKIEEFKQKQLV